MKITYFIGNHSATGFYRQVIPMGALRRNGMADLVEISTGVLAGQIEKVLGSDVIAWGEVVELSDLFEKLRERGMTIIADYCDNYEAITGFSQGYREWGIQEFEVVLDADADCEHKKGSTVKVWADGINFNIAENKKRRKKRREAIRFCDLITTTTPVLKERLLEQGARAVEVLPDCVDFKNWRRLKLADDGWIRLFWQGSDIHYQDFRVLREPLKIIMAKYPKTKLVVLGYQVKSVLRDIPGGLEREAEGPEARAHPAREAGYLGTPQARADQGVRVGARLHRGRRGHRQQGRRGGLVGDGEGG